MRMYVCLPQVVRPANVRQLGKGSKSETTKNYVEAVRLREKTLTAESLKMEAGGIRYVSTSKENKKTATDSWLCSTNVTHVPNDIDEHWRNKKI